MDFLLELDSIRIRYQKALLPKRQLELGQFFTPPSIANMMANMVVVNPDKSVLTILDPGSGVGTLSAALILKIIKKAPWINKIELSVYEIDKDIVPGLKETLEECLNLCAKTGVALVWKIFEEDFIESVALNILGEYSLFPVAPKKFDIVIMNPPYKKINSASRTWKLLRDAGVETTNYYSAFLWLSLKQLEKYGELVAIIPRSFCNGTYFKPLRHELLKTARFQQIHMFEARDQAFKESNVLQENIIVKLARGLEHSAEVIISKSQNPDDEDVVIQKIPHQELIRPDDPQYFIRIPANGLNSQLNTYLNNLHSTLEELGIRVSTGRVVDFRCRSLLRFEPDVEVIPLIHPNNLQMGYVVWPKVDSKRPNYLALSEKVDQILVPKACYVLVKRFSSKEEKKRITAAFFDPDLVPYQRIGFENHLNYFYSSYGSLPRELAKGLTLYLNSSLVDQYFRQFSGHTQVNVSDLLNMRYPSRSQLVAMGKRFLDELPDQDSIDRIIAEELDLTDQPLHTDPILAKKKINEALKILQMLGVPKAQQNDRSALSLLALVNIRPNSSWMDAEQNLIGITEMMDFFREYYGINYAPNTRETVRRYTIHQFLQLSLVIQNPDGQKPINSPKNRYIIEPNSLDLIRNFGAIEWEALLRSYIIEKPSLLALQVKEREMNLLPVLMPNGEQLLLTGGGQNELIKKIIEEFCPRFTPGGKIVSVGDAGEKLTEIEIENFLRLGFDINRHGKMPDVVVDYSEKRWLVLIEAVTSHGPIDLKRRNELREIFRSDIYGLVFVTAFDSRKAMNKYLSTIAWETEVWVAEAPSHLIHFDGEKFLGPYED